MTGIEPRRLGEAPVATRRKPNAAGRDAPAESAAESTPQAAKPEASWTFLTNHAHVLLCIAKRPEVRMRDVADLVGITERAVQRIVSDLADAGYVERIRQGRRNHYVVRGDLPLRHPIEMHEKVSSLITLVHGEGE
jgi:predicted transcriptional regulator